MSARRNFSFRDSAVPTQWAALIALTLLLSGVLIALRLPAGLMLGAIVAAAAISNFDGKTHVSSRAFIMAQAAIGGMIAQKMTPAILHEMARDWPLFIAAAFSVVAVSGLFGWLLTKWRLFPGTTAIWGALPGAASAMVVMADAYGADMRLVAFMQYLRVLLVALVASLIARFWAPGAGAGAGPLAHFFAPVAWPAFAVTLAVLLGAAFVAQRLRIPAGPLLLPLFVGALAQDSGLFALELPPRFLALNYAILGWCVGQRFSRAILLHAFKALPAILGSVVALIALCAGLSVILAAITHKDPLTAYLAMSPGGIDAVAIIAASAKLDLPFVMALQAARVLMVILIGPGVARFLSGAAPAASTMLAGDDDPAID
ncbi:AbrB family transcriptional regulator [Rhodoblastus acidophilus]|uniref:AbrB family transcriptional regulator n=1 Tax=Candidatus Rhodoblastus alkanivorans TaxID=2954117 RepID=A0ABS9Z976_9HYPH|nr:AbrB family transcriptional regulator [Candidatus Rhodoblastus alkanivorans]MCI4678873.1 AbrB family transcriptional regulator [Candidatus Rhodoblastus alkanivorans]MCI4684203.1 AbrB family transcriptional regulator [Candidatus Rhodoblastus alkanivorans]MDI4641524.1 AbrB family transcriptional regulator [Rhodoblastus acidophilus]